MRTDLRDDRPPERFRLVLRGRTRRPLPGIVLFRALFTALVCGALCVAAILVPAPPAIVPLVALTCVGCPMFASWQVPTALASVRAKRARGRALESLRQSLAQLPEVEHPLGL